MVTKPRGQPLPQSALWQFAHQHEWVVDVTTGRVVRRSCQGCTPDSAAADERLSLDDALARLLAATELAAGDAALLAPATPNLPTA